MSGYKQMLSNGVDQLWIWPASWLSPAHGQALTNWLELVCGSLYGTEPCSLLPGAAHTHWPWLGYAASWQGCSHCNCSCLGTGQLPTLPPVAPPPLAPAALLQVVGVAGLTAADQLLPQHTGALAPALSCFPPILSTWHSEQPALGHREGGR